MELLWLWIILGIIGLFLLIVFISSIICFHLSMYRYSKWNTEKNPVDFSGLGKFSEEAERNDKWFHEAGEVVSVKSKDNLTLRGYYFKNPNAKRTVILMHGYRGKPEYDFCLIHHWLYENESNVLVPYQRAHGLSEGKYISMGYHERDDLHSWVEYVETLDDLPIYLFGISMGCATTMLSFYRPYSERVKGAICDCGYHTIYSSLRDEVGKYAGKFIASFLMFFSNFWTHMIAHYGLYKLDTRKVLKDVKIPIIFAHGDADNFVLPYHTKMNYEACGSEHKTLIIGKGATHGHTILTNELEYKQAILDMFKEND